MSELKGIAQQVLLVILDGFGINDNTIKNAVRDARKPTIDELFSHYPFTTIEAGGLSVGLPKGVPGNSEVGHMNLGAGKPVRQDLVRINEAIQDHSFANLPLLKELCNVADKKTKRIHIMGLLSDGGVHSHIDHLIESVQAIQSHGDFEIFFHAFMDGRDTAPDCGSKYVEEVLKLKGCHFASMQGRSIGMDRDRRWDKIEKAYRMMTGEGQTTDQAPLEYLKSEYKSGRLDEFVNPVLFKKEYAIKNDDCIFFINFRPDRAIQITLAFMDPKFKEFSRTVTPGYFLCMTPYVPDEVSLPILFDKERIPGGLSEYLSQNGMAQFKIAETEKYAHVTYFFNGGEKKPFPKEKQVLIPSPKEVATYDLKPEMSARQVTEKLIEALDDNTYKFYLVNFANGDMVGHTGNYNAAVEAVQILDECLAKLAKKCAEKNILMMITADHGNCDQMVYPDGVPHTSHTGAPVPFCIVHPKLKDKKIPLSEGHLALKDVASTVLYSLGITIPNNFEGSPIFK
ncbi:MAG: 2,3-bisphosphoglycerate-independent phosphoglycerate mutase [Bacteriovoracaceae bacterium]